MKVDIEKIVTYVFIGGLAVLTQWFGDKQTERLASRAAANAVVNILSEAKLIEEKPPDEASSE